MSPAISRLTVYNLIIVSALSLFYGVCERAAEMTEQNGREDYYYYSTMSFQLRAEESVMLSRLVVSSLNKEGEKKNSNGKLKRLRHKISILLFSPI